MTRLNVTPCFISAESDRSAEVFSAPWVHRAQLEPLHRPAGPPVRNTRRQTPSETPAAPRSTAVTHPSLWPLLQTLQEPRHVVIVVDGELHVLPHNPDGHVLEGKQQLVT